MVRLGGPALVGVLLFALWIYCVVDVLATDRSRTRNLPKTVWLLIVVFVPTVGAVAWLAFGRPRYSGLAPGAARRRPVRSVRGPEDDAEWIASIGARDDRTPPRADERDLEVERDLERWERELGGAGPADDDTEDPRGRA